MVKPIKFTNNIIFYNIMEDNLNNEVVAEELQTLDEVMGGTQNETANDEITGMPYPW